MSVMPLNHVTFTDIKNYVTCQAQPRSDGSHTVIRVNKFS